MSTYQESLGIIIRLCDEVVIRQVAGNSITHASVRVAPGFDEIIREARQAAQACADLQFRVSRDYNILLTNVAHVWLPEATSEQLRGIIRPNGLHDTW